MTNKQNGLPSYNGSGPGSTNPFVKYIVNPIINNEGKPLWNFTPAGNFHDMCYGTCGSDKSKCDKEFRSNMESVCSAYAYLPGLENECKIQALIYFKAVSKGGQDSYDSAQEKGCQWEECCHRHSRDGF